MANFFTGKIIYLDEQAVFDFLELHQNGIQSDIIKRVSENMVEVGTEGKIGMNFFTRFKIGLSGNASYQRSGVVESQITSTLLSNFKKLVTNKNKKEASKVEYIDNVKLFIEKDSPAYYRNITPVLDMVSDINKMNSITDDEKNNFKGIELKNIERTLDRLSGYYEIKGISTESKENIFRFNISGLRNNYTLSDLTKMDVKLYGIKVGEVDSIDLSFDTMIDRLSNQRQSQVGADFDDEQVTEKIPIYDVLVAGV